MIVVSFFEGKPMSVVREGMSATIVILISGLLTSWQNQILGYSIARQIQNYVSVHKYHYFSSSNF